MNEFNSAPPEAVVSGGFRRNFRYDVNIVMLSSLIMLICVFLDDFIMLALRSENGFIVMLTSLLANVTRDEASGMLVRLADSAAFQNICGIAVQLIMLLFPALIARKALISKPKPLFPLAARLPEHPFAYVGMTFGTCYTVNVICSLLFGSFSAGVTPDAVRAALDGTDTELAVLSDGKTQTTVGILCLKEDLERVNAALLPLGFIRATFPAGTGTASEAIRRTRAKIKTLGGEDAALIEGLKADAARVGLLEILSDFEKTKLAAYGAMAQSGQTHYTALLTGYLPARRQKAVEKALDAFDCDYAIEEVPDGEEAPVELRNNGFAKNFEWVMGMYSYPAYGTYDPTFIMSIFYFIIFGLMFADAGYGLLLVLAGFGAIRLLHPKPGMRAFLAMFGYCGISSMIWGVLMGSYFGDFPLAYMQHMTAMTEVPKTLALWFDPIQNPMNFLILSLGVGAVHLIAGMAVKFSVIWKSGKPLDAIFDIGSWGVLFAGLGLLAVKPEIGKWVALAGVAMLVLTQGRAEKNIIMKLGKGIFSLYDLISYGSDLLSYSRILALGLASAVIGQVVNILATLVGPSVGGFIAMVVIFIVGHLLNLVINVLGTFVHTSRLQYIEFFGKFFVDGGKPFRPLAPADEYTYREEKREE